MPEDEVQDGDNAFSIVIDSLCCMYYSLMLFPEDG
jgi:hypothetical protein